MMKRLACVILALLIAGTSHADDYAQPNWTNLVRTLVRFNALDLSDDHLLDEYAIVTECDLYTTMYNDEFKWHKVREAIRGSVQMNVATFPTSYSYDTKLQLDRYDFKEKLYRFTDKATIANVNAFTIYDVDGTPCKGTRVHSIPRSYRAVLDTPLYIEGLPLDPKDAEALLRQMESDKNTDRIVYVRFNLRVVFVEPIRRDLTEDSSGEINYSQSGGHSSNRVRLDARLDSVQFYSDTAMTKLIYDYRP